MGTFHDWVMFERKAGKGRSGRREEAGFRGESNTSADSIPLGRQELALRSTQYHVTLPQPGPWVVKVLDLTPAAAAVKVNTKVKVQVGRRWFLCPLNSSLSSLFPLVSQVGFREGI